MTAVTTRPARAGVRWLRDAEWDGLPAVTEMPSPDGQLLLTEVVHDLAVRRPDERAPRRITRCGTPDRPWRVNAQLYSVLPPGPVWSPDGRRVVSVRADLTGVPRRSFPDPSGGSRPWPAPVESSPCRGLARLAIIDVADAGVVWADLPGRVQWTPVRWSDDGAELLVLGFDFAGELWLCRVDTTTGGATTLVKETVPGVFPYLAPLHSAVTARLPEVAESLWTSDRDGDLRLYRVDGAGAAALTPTGVQVVQVLDASPDAGILLVARTGGSAAPYERRRCVVEPDGSFHVLNPEPDDPRGEGTAFVVPAADGRTGLHGRVFTPPGFDPRRGYAVIDCIYGGPQTIAHVCAHASPAHHTWGCSVCVAQALAQRGYVAVVLDSRGTPGRGRAFQWPATPARGDVVIDDHLSALRALAAERPWMDLTRAGIIGTSFGAYHAVRAALVDPGLFRAVVAHAGPYSPADALPGWFPGVLGADYDRNPGAYADADLVDRAAELAAALLLVHGTEDANVPIDSTRRLSAALTAAGREHELLLLPGQRHHLGAPADLLALDRAARFFDRHL